MGYSGWGLGWFKRKRAREGDPDTGGPRSGGNLGSAGGSPRAGAEPATRQHKRPAEKKVSFQAEGRTTRATQHQPALPEGKSSKPPGQKRPHKQRGEQAVSGAPGSSETAESPKGWRSSTRHRGEQQQQEEENEGSKQDKPAASKKTRLASNAKSQQPRTRARQNAVAGQAASQRPSEQIGQQQQRRPRTLAVLPSEQQQQDQKPQKAEAKPSGRGRTPARGTAADDGLPGPSNRLAEPVVEPPAAGGNEPAKPTGMKRVRSSWKMRPLFTDEKLRVFVEGRDDELALYDDGEFYRWLTDCEAGKANPEDGFCYPLVVQDQDMRTVLEIKPLAAAKPAAGQAEAEGKGTAAKPRREDAIGHLAAEGPIRVPLIRVLPQEQQPDMMLEAELVAAEQAQAASKAQDSPSPEDAGGPGSSRPGSGPLPSVRRAGATAAVDGAGAQSDEDEGAGDADPPYVRYLEPTPDDLDLQVEYDLDEEDEEWLEAFNERARKGKSRKARLRLNEDWMERLMDRMEKEYTHALQRHPEKWVIQQQPDGSSSDMPSITLPRIEEVFSLQDCLQAPGMHHYPSILEAVYNYWKGKHTRAGSPLIQRLWYEPPWHRKKAAERVAEEEAGEGGPFLALDPLEQLQGVRRRKLDTEEIRSRFSELRRDLDAARLLADQVRRREKLKKQELRIFQQEWAARLAEIEAGQPVTLRNGELRYPPPTLSTLGRLRAAGGEDTLAVGAPGEQEGPAEAAVEDRAARLAARREARLAVVAAGDKRKRPSEADQAGRKGQNPAPLRKEKLQKGKEQERAPSPHASGNTASEVAGDAADATTSSPERRGRKARQQQQQPLQKQTMGPSTAHKNQQRLRQQLQQEEEEAMQNAAHLRQRNRGNVEDAVDVAAGLGKPAAAGQSRREQAGGGRNHGKPSRAAAAALGQRRHDDGRAGTGKHAAAARPQGRQAGDDGRHSKPSRGAAVEQLPKPAPARSTKKRRRQQAHPAPAQETVNGVDDPASEVDSDVTHKENQAPARPPKRTRAAAPSPPRKPSHHAQQQQAQHGSRRAPAATRRPAAASPLSREVLALLKQTIPDFAQGLRR